MAELVFNFIGILLVVGMIAFLVTYPLAILVVGTPLLIIYTCN